MEPATVKHRRTAPARPLRGAGAGFTLIELLVVIVIIGIVVSFAVLSVNVNEGRELKEQAQRVAGLIQLAHQQSILDARELAVQFKDGGYRFYAEGQDGHWAEWNDKGGPFDARKFPTGVAVGLTIDGEDASSDKSGVGSMLPDGGNDEQKQPKRLIYILSSGELTPFELTLTREGGDGYKITGTINGDVSMERYHKS